MYGSKHRNRPGGRSNLAARMGRWSAAHWKTATFGWLAFVLVAFGLGGAVGMKSIDDNAPGPGESGRMDRILDAGFQQPAGENVLVQNEKLSTTDPAFRAAVGDALPGVPYLIDPGALRVLDTRRVTLPPEATRREALAALCSKTGAEFAIESVRIVLNDEYLASIASGPGWHGLGEIYHQSLVLRPGERLSLPVVVPRDASWIAELGTRIKNTHFKEFSKKGTDHSLESFRTLLDGTTNWPAVMEALDKIGYRDYLTFEYFHPFSHYPEALVYQTADALNRMLGRP